MASQQVLFAETIAGMKKAFKRRAYESDSDSEIDHYTNRGHKLKKRARFVRKGQLIPSTGPSAYKEELEYAGVRRSILYRNPPLVDDDGYEVYSGDEDERMQEAALTAAELNPYANLRLEHILAPLTASTDLPTHPIFSKPFTSKTLTELVDHSCRIMRKENQSLWEVRHMWTALYGDGTWLPCELMVGENDAELYSKEFLPPPRSKRTASAPAMVNGTQNGESHEGKASKTGSPREAESKGDTSMVDADTDEKNTSIEKSTGDSSTEQDKQAGTAGDRIHKEAETDGSSIAAAEAEDPPPFTHPMFLPPVGARPDRDLGLPGKEADDIRMLVALYVQKQEEVCRGTERLHEGLLRAERLRNDVLHWSKAEAHCGPNRDLSDGEDWYDREEWGLDEDLKKGQDEEEEEVTTQGKKTRARR